MAFIRRVDTTLRPEEVDLLDDWAKKLDAKDKWRPNYGRRGILRAAARYALEHQTKVEAWIARETGE